MTLAQPTHLSRTRKRGPGAARPSVGPGRKWKDVLARTRSQIQRDRAPLIAAGVTFYATLAIFPAIVALVSIYGFVSSPAAVQQQLESLTVLLPDSARNLLSDYLMTTTRQSSEALGWGVALGLVGALWSASSGTASLIKALNIAYDEQETRGFFKLRGQALLFTLAAMLFAIGSVLLLAVVPGLLRSFGQSPLLETTLRIARWPLLSAVALLGLGAVYRYAPDRPPPPWRRVWWGAALATAAWLLASILLSLYASHFGKFGDTYGPLAGIIVLMLWLFVSCFAVLLGAELNSQLELQQPFDGEYIGELHAQPQPHWAVARPAHAVSVATQPDSQRADQLGIPMPR